MRNSQVIHGTGVPDPWLWPGEGPFCAFGQHGIDRLDVRVFDQSTWWVDRLGVGHQVADMDLGYVRNVVRHLRENADDFHAATCRRWRVQSEGDRLLARHELAAQAAALERTCTDLTPAAWLAMTPLMRRLRDRLDSASDSHD